MSWKREFETKCDAYELNIDEITGKKKWTKRGINGDLIIYSHTDNLNDFKVRFELFSIQIWWKVFNPKLKKKGSKTRVITFKRLSTAQQTKETIALRFKNPQICTSFIAKWESLTRDMDYETTDDEDDDDDDDHKHHPYYKMDEVKQEEDSLLQRADKSSFRDLIKINLLPSMDLINSASILNEYYFNYGITDKIEIKNNSLNYANYSYGKYNNEEHYLSLWMNSEVLRRVFISQYKRQRVNMVIVLDKSESMNESLCINERSRMEIAQEALTQLVRHSLDKQDRFAIITYNERPKIEHPLTLIDSLPYGMVDLRRDIVKFKASGTTDLEKAYKYTINKIFTDKVLSEAKHENVYNRIIFMTDLQLDPSKRHAIFGMIKEAAMKKQIYTTFMSMGIEQDKDMMASSIAKVRGCNYLTVHNKQEFISKFHKDKEFAYMIGPILYDLNVSLNTTIQQVYTGENNKRIKNGQLLQIQSMFGNLNYSSPLIIKFNYKKGLKLNIGFTDKNGKRNQSEQIIDLTYMDDNDGVDDIYDSNDDDYDNNNKSKLVQEKDFYDSIGIRKVVLLCRYMDLLRLWIKVDSKSVQNDEENGNKLLVSNEFKKRFNEFAKYFEKEMNEIGDKTLQKELHILKKLATYEDTVDVD